MPWMSTGCRRYTGSGVTKIGSRETSIFFASVFICNDSEGARVGSPA